MYYNYCFSPLINNIEAPIGHRSNLYRDYPHLRPVELVSLNLAPVKFRCGTLFQICFFLTSFQSRLLLRGACRASFYALVDPIVASTMLEQIRIQEVSWSTRLLGFDTAETTPNQCTWTISQQEWPPQFLTKIHASDSRVALRALRRFLRSRGKFYPRSC